MSISLKKYRAHISVIKNIWLLIQIMWQIIIPLKCYHLYCVLCIVSLTAFNSSGKLQYLR